MKSRRVLVRGLAVALPIAVLALAACSTPSASPSSSSDGINIAYLGYTPISDFPAAFLKGAESVVKPDGGSVTYFAANFDPQAQITQCQDAITSGRYQAIILAPVDPATGVPCVTAAKAAGIPVATVETAVGTDPYSIKPQVDGVVAVANTPLKTQVALEVELIKSACENKKPCEIIGEVASPTDRWTNDLMTAVGKAVAPDATIVQNIVTQYDPGEIARSLPDALNAHPDAAVYLATADQTALAAVPVIAEAGKTAQVKIIGLGGSSEAAAAVKDGSLFATTGLWPQQTGALLAKALVQSLAGEKVTTPGIDLDKLDKPSLITKDTVDQFKPEWGAGS